MSPADLQLSSGKSHDSIGLHNNNLNNPFNRNKAIHSMTPTPIGLNSPQATREDREAARGRTIDMNELADLLA